jgi:hypothetical protein
MGYVERESEGERDIREYMLKGMHKKERKNKETYPKSQNHQKGEKGKSCQKECIHHTHTHADLDQVV